MPKNQRNRKQNIQQLAKQTNRLNSKQRRERRWVGSSMRHTATKIYREKQRPIVEFHAGILQRNGGNWEELDQIHTQP